MEHYFQTHLIPNDLCKQAGLSMSWAPTNDIGVFANHRVDPKGKDVKSSFSGKEASVFQVRQHAMLFDPILRKLVNESNGTFLNLQELMSGNVVDVKVEVLKRSRQYRSIIRACLEDLQEETLHANDERLDEVQNYVTIFYSIECVWHLCEILFIETIPGNAVLPRLLEWISFHFPKYERRAATLLAGELVNLDSHADYWETVTGLFMQGRVEVVRTLLKLHSAAESKPFKLAEQTLKAMPIYNLYDGISVTEYHFKWKDWLLDAKSKVDAKLFLSDKHLHQLMRLAVGDEVAWNEVKNQCEAWYEFLAAWLFSTNPTVKAYELGDYARLCITKMNMTSRMRYLDQVLLAAMELNIIQVFKEIQCMSENGWFVCHLTDLVYHAGCLASEQPEAIDLMGKRLRESFLLNYGTTLMGHHSLWQVGLDYLDYCEMDGKNVIQLLICRLPLGTEARVQKIIREAQKRDLPQVVQSICKVHAMNLMQRGRLGNALSWALKSQDGSFTSILADRFLQEYCKNGNLQCIDLLDNLGSCILVSDRLIFLGKYFEFHKVYQEKNYKEAADLLISLLASKLTPTYFWVTLLCDALPLLECDKLVMSSNDTYTLLHCLEEKRDVNELKDKIQLIRLAIARNLARAHMHEAQQQN